MPKELEFEKIHSRSKKLSATQKKNQNILRTYHAFSSKLKTTCSFYWYFGLIKSKAWFKKYRHNIK